MYEFVLIQPFLIGIDIASAQLPRYGRFTVRQIPGFQKQAHAAEVCTGLRFGNRLAEVNGVAGRVLHWQKEESRFPGSGFRFVAGWASLPEKAHLLHLGDCRGLQDIYVHSARHRMPAVISCIPCVGVHPCLQLT